MTTLEILPDDILRLILARGGFHPSLGSVNRRLRNVSKTTPGSVIATDRYILSSLRILAPISRCLNSGIKEIMTNLDAIKGDSDLRTAVLYMGTFNLYSGLIKGSMSIRQFSFTDFIGLATRFFSAERMQILRADVAPYASELRITNFLGWIQLVWKETHGYELIGWSKSVKLEMEVNNDTFQPPNEDKLDSIKEYILN